MARRSTPAALRLLLLPAVLVIGVAALGSAPAGAQEAPSATLTDLLSGSVDGLDAAATVSTLDGGGLELVVDNSGDDPVEVAIPFGTLVATEVEGDQTLVVGPPDTAAIAEVAASGGTPTITVEPGSSTTELAVYCAELDDGFPYEPTEVHPLGESHEVLASALRQATAERSDYTTTQDAVWWLSDQPVVPVDDALAPLLADVDTAAFAADPFRVVPDTGYDPAWMRDEVAVTDGGEMDNGPDDEQAAGIIDEAFDAGAGTGSSSSSGGGAGFALWVVLAGVVAVATVVIATRAGRSGPQAATAPVMAAGWYPDPWGGPGHRYWDGRSWTQRTLR